MKKWALSLLVLMVTTEALALTVEGKEFEPSVKVSGKTLTRVGAGLRKKGWIDVCVLGAYTESGSCRPAKVIGDEEVKYLRFQMLRNVKGSKMASTIGNAFDDAIPDDADSTLRSQRDVFKSYFKETVRKNQTLEFTYVPGEGVVFRQDGRQLGAPLEGKPFQETFWSIYFGSKTCCRELRDAILADCE
jgi:hypothetical protein